MIYKDNKQNVSWSAFDFVVSNLVDVYLCLWHCGCV